MGFLNNLFNKINSGFYYIVNKDTLEKYLRDELSFSLENNLEASANLNIYLNGEKKHIQIWNYQASKFKSEQEKGLIIYCNKEELKTIDELFASKLNNLPQYFKIELIDTDNEFLNNYKKQHPELNINNYK